MLTGPGLEKKPIFKIKKKMEIFQFSSFLCLRQKTAHSVFCNCDRVFHRGATVVVPVLLLLVLWEFFFFCYFFMLMLVASNRPLYLWLWIYGYGYKLMSFCFNGVI